MPDGSAGDVSRVGAPGFAAPEAEPVPAGDLFSQVAEAGEGQDLVPAGDLFSLGATVYFAVEGVPPFSGDGPMAVLSAVLSADPRAPERAGDLGPVLLALLAKDPAHRPRDAVETIERVAAGTRTGRRITVGRGRLAVFAGSLAVALVSATTIATVLLTSPDRAPPDTVVQTGPAPQAVADDEPGRFAAPPRACGLLTDDQVGQLVPSGYKDRGFGGGNADPDSACRIDAARLDDTAPTVRIDVLRHSPGPLGGGPATAREFVSALRAEAASGPTVLGDTVSNVREPAGQGDAAVVYDLRRETGHRRSRSARRRRRRRRRGVDRHRARRRADPGRRRAAARDQRRRDRPRPPGCARRRPRARGRARWGGAALDRPNPRRPLPARRVRGRRRAPLHAAGGPARPDR